MDGPQPPIPPSRSDPPRGPRFGWRDFSVRAALNNHSSAAAIFAVVLLLIALGVILWSSEGPPRPQLMGYYYDLNTQRVFVDHAGRTVPFDRGLGNFEYPDGLHGSAVRATVYTCGAPGDVRPGMTAAELEGVGAFVATLHRLSPDRLVAQRNAEAGEDFEDHTYGDYTSGSGELVAAADGLMWHSPESEAGRLLLSAHLDHCGPDETLRVCLP